MFSTIESICIFVYGLMILPLVQLICKVLPASPFRSFLVNPPEGTIEWIRAINYFVPLKEFIMIVSLWMPCMFTWYMIRWIINIFRNVTFTEIKSIVTSFIKPNITTDI